MPLNTPATLGALALRNRIVMAPLTRRRAELDGTPNDLMTTYYRQRASVGLIVTEGTWPIQEGRSWFGQPGIETEAHVEGWRRIADAVHEAGGSIVMQVMHGGRISAPAVSGTGRTVAPSAITPPGALPLPDGTTTPFVQPRELTADEIDGVILAFAAAAARARSAGIDGVEVHAANGYLLHQFLAPTSNHRTDGWGGTPENRAKLAVEVTAAVAAEIGADRTAIRISPARNIQGVIEDDPADILATYTALADALPRGLAFVDLLYNEPNSALADTIRDRSQAPLVVNPGGPTPTTRDQATALITTGTADAVGVGRMVLANPDLVTRWASGSDVNAPDPGTFYDGGAPGYTDYPALSER